MSAPIRDDSGYFENDMSDEDGQDMENTKNLLPVPEQRTVKRTASTSSMHSQISQGSSQLWDGFSTPDEDAVRAADEAMALYQAERELEEPQSQWRPDDRPKPKPLETARFDPNPSASMDLERRLSQCDGLAFPQSVYQRRRLESKIIDEPSACTTSPTSSEHTNVFIQGSSSSSSPNARPPIMIAHSDNHQNFFDKHKLPWGVQWEIARLVSCGRIQYDDIPLDSLKDLAGSNAVAAPMVEQCLCPKQGGIQRRRIYDEAFAKELGTKMPWAELDNEEESLARDPLSGLGCNSEHDDWYGGKVAFVAKLRQEEQDKKSSKNIPRYFLELEPPELSASTRFMRRWGSRRFLRVRIPDSVMYQRDNKLLTYFRNIFVIHGKVFRPFYAKENGVFLLEIDFKFTQNRVVPDPDQGKLSLCRFLEWHNPMRINNKQSLAKWCARMALGLSNSVPGIEIAAEHIMEIDDIYSPAGQADIAAGRKPDSIHVMTDGCGFANYTFFLYLKHKFNWELVPSAIQYRLGGAKGLLLQHPDDNCSVDEPPRVWIRPSQKKISYTRDSAPDRAHLVLDVLRRSHLKSPARLSTEIIVNLAQNGVSYDVFEGLMKNGLQEIAAKLTQWSGPYAMQNLWASVQSFGSVIRARMSREAAGASRALGFGSRDKDDEEEAEDEEAMEFVQTRSKPWWADEISGCPSTLEETVLILLDAGFEPQSCHILAAKLKEVFKKALNSYIEKYKIIVPCSAEAWIVPDPHGVLEPGEIFFRTSELIVGQDGLKRDHLLGDVLITRHPCCVPSDVQKVRAVWRDELRKYSDVIVLSTKGERSLASMLAGGDHDGDTAHSIWDPAIVTAFRNADDKFADPPPGLDDAFEKNTTTVEAFLEKHREPHSTPAMISERQDYLLAAIKDVSLVGQYSNWHDVAVYKHGYEHNEAWRLAYMFCAVLDSSKTGKTVRPEILRQDRLLYHGPPPAWKVSLLDETPANNQFAPPQDEAPRRQGKLLQLKFIMDQLKNAARKQYHHHMAEFEKLLKASREQFKADQGIMTAGLYVDPALEAPWRNAMGRAQKLIQEDSQYRMEHELDNIRIHVQRVRDRHRELLRQDRGKGRNDRPPVSPRKDSSSFTDKPIEQRQNILRDLSLEFNHMPEDLEFIALSPDEVRRCRASYAYILETERQERRSQGYSRFPFDVAMRELGFIKAASIGPCNMVSSRFYSVFNVVGAIRAFRPEDGPAYTY